MPVDADETFIGATGRIYVGAVGSTPPTNATSSPDAAFFDLGYVSEDGPALTPAKTSEALMGWQSFFQLRRFVTGIDFSVTFALLQHNQETIKLAMGGGTWTGTTQFTPADPSTLDERALILDVQDGSRTHRWYFPKGIITDTGEIRYNRAGGAMFTLTYAPELSEGDNLFEIFFNDSEISAT